MHKYIRARLVQNNPTAYSIISNLMKQQATFERCSAIDFLLHVVFSLDTLFVSTGNKHAMYVLQPMLHMKLDFTFPHVKTLKSYFIVDNFEEDLELYKSLFPDIKSMWFQETETNLEVLKKLWPDLEELLFPGCRTPLHSNNWLCNIFFDGLSFSQVENIFIEDNTPVLSFKKLRRLSMSISPCRNHEFLSLLLHYYPHLDFQVEEKFGGDDSVSSFSSYISHNVSLNPHLRLSHCNIRVEDLGLNYIEQLLQSWICLESLSFILTSSANLLDIEKLTKTFISILKNCNRLHSLQIKVYFKTKANSAEKCVSLILKSLKQCGKKIRKLEVHDKENAISYDDMVTMVNSCPNLTHLDLYGKWKKKINNFSKTKLFNPLIHLTHFLFASEKDDFDVSASKLMSLNTACTVVEMLKSAPNLFYLQTNINANMIDHLSGKGLPSNILVWHFLVMGQFNFESLSSLVNKSNLQRIIIDELHDVAPGHCYMAPEEAQEVRRQTLSYMLSTRMKGSSLLVQLPLHNHNRLCRFHWMSMYDFGL